MLNIALPKGRLGDKVYTLFKSLGYDCEAMEKDDRRLVLTDENSNISYLLVKPSDVAIYVEHGAADVGVVGKDVLLEGENDVYELLDLDFGKCRMAEAAPVGFHEDIQRPLCVATKYPNIAKKFYAGLSREIEVIKLNGSIELAPLLQLSDVIVDIVETGTTLKQNDLEVTREIVPVSARFIANKASMKFKDQQIKELTQKLAEEIQRRRTQK
ncbi:MAG: ATP phosphoribosyltransferase [Clostridiales bacterium]|nr:ATP phosphoribosyltransferase [Clostridiales bacterium]